MGWSHERARGDPEKYERESPKESDIKEILSGNSEKIVELAQSWGERLDGIGISNKKGRQIFDTIIGFDWEKDSKKLPLLRPKLAYMAAREKKALNYQRFLDEALRLVKTKDEFNNLKSFVEAVLAFTKYNEAQRG